MRLTVIGPGRLGRSLAQLLPRAGHTVHLIGRGEALPTQSVDAILLTVPDGQLRRVAASLPTGGPPVLHCSGACEVDVLRPHAPAGSLHPLMTFPGPEIALPALDGVPAAIAGDPEAAQLAWALAESLGMKPLEISGDRRLYHAAAVMAGNFATVLLADAARVLHAAGVPSSEAARALVPLALASLRNAGPDPASALTGPAVRGDHDTLDAHRDALSRPDLRDVAAVYDLMTARAQALTSTSAADPPPEVEPRGSMKDERRR